MIQRLLVQRLQYAVRNIHLSNSINGSIRNSPGLGDIPGDGSISNDNRPQHTM